MVREWFFPLDRDDQHDEISGLRSSRRRADCPAHGHISGFGGYAKYGDNDTAQNNRREVYYYSIEGVQAVTKKLYAAARFSQIFAHKGFPISGHGDMGAYYWNPFACTENVSGGLRWGWGYQWSPNLLTKVDYSFEGEGSQWRTPG